MNVIFQIEQILDFLNQEKFINLDQVINEKITICQFYKYKLHKQYNLNQFYQVYSQISSQIQDLVEIHDKKQLTQEYFHQFQIPIDNQYESQNIIMYVCLKQKPRSYLDKQNQFKLTDNQKEAKIKLELFLDQCYQKLIINDQEIKKYKDQLQKQLKIYTKESYLSYYDDHDIPYYFYKQLILIPDFFNGKIQNMDFQFINHQTVSVQFPSQKNSHQYCYQNTQSSIDSNSTADIRNQQKNRDHNNNLNKSPLQIQQNHQQNEIENNEILYQQDQKNFFIFNNSTNNARRLISTNNKNISLYSNNYVNQNINPEQHHNGINKNTMTPYNQYNNKQNINMIQKIPHQNQQNNDLNQNCTYNELNLISDNSHHNEQHLEKNIHAQVKQNSYIIIKSINPNQNYLKSNQCVQNEINIIKNKSFILILKNGKIKGFQNINGSCYVNTSLQVLQQINYLNNNIFNSNQFGEKLKNLFNTNYYFEEKQILQYIINLQNKFQDSQAYGGDSFICLLTLIDEIENNYGQKNNLFINQFEHKLEKGPFCQKCNCFIQDLEDTFYEETEIGVEINRIEMLFRPLVNSSPEKCPYCNLSLVMLQIMKSVPIFLFVKVDNKSYKQINENIFYQPISYDREDKTYRIIGVCNYFGNHYSYTAKYDDKWYELNDSKIEQKLPSHQNALFYVLEQQQ